MLLPPKLAVPSPSRGFVCPWTWGRASGSGLCLTHERTQGDDGLWAQHVVTVQAQVCKPPENHSVPLTAAPRGEGTAGTGGDTEPPQDNTALTRVAQGVTRCQEGQGAPGGDAAALSLPETSTDRISVSLQPSPCATQLGRSWFVLVTGVTAVLLPSSTVSPCWGPHGLLCHHGLASHLEQCPTGQKRDRNRECQAGEAGELPSALNPAPQ